MKKSILLFLCLCLILSGCARNVPPRESDLPTGTLSTEAIPVEILPPEQAYTAICRVSLPDGAEVVLTGARAEAMERLLNDIFFSQGEPAAGVDVDPSAGGITLSFEPPEDQDPYGLGTSGIYWLDAEERAYWTFSIYTSFAESRILPAGSYQAVLAQLDAEPLTEETLAACVRALPGGGAGTYSYELYDLDGNYVTGLGPYAKSLSFHRVGTWIVVCGSDGPSRATTWRVYYDPASGALSQPYGNVLWENEGMALCGGLDRVTAYKTMSGEVWGEITAFSEPLAPTADSPFLSASWEGTVFSVRYLAGDDYHEAADLFYITVASSASSADQITFRPVERAETP